MENDKQGAGVALDSDVLMALRKQWIGHFQNALKNEGEVLLLIKTENDSILISSSPGEIRLATQVESYEKLLESCKIDLDTETSLAHEKVIATKLVEAFSCAESKLRFFGKSKGTRSFPLMPPHPVAVYRKMDEKLFWKSCLCAADLYYAPRIPGNIVFTGKVDEVGIWLTLEGAAVGERPTTESSFAFAENEETAIAMLQKAIDLECTSLFFPENVPAEKKTLLALPGEPIFSPLLSLSSWEKLAQFYDMIPNETSTQQALACRWMQSIQEVFQCNILDEAGIGRLRGVMAWSAILIQKSRDIKGPMLERIRAMEAEDSQASYRMLQEISRLYPDDADLLATAGQSALSLDLRQDAASYSTKLGDLCLATQDSENALKQYEYALDLAPGFAEAQLGRIQSYIQQGNIEQVKKLARDAACALRLEKESQARLARLCKIVLEMDPNFIEFRKEWINIFLESGQTKEAVEHYLILARFYEQTEDKEQLIQCYQKITKIAPDRKDIVEKLEILQKPSLKDTLRIQSKAASGFLIAMITGVVFLVAAVIFIINVWPKDNFVDAQQEKPTTKPIIPEKPASSPGELVAKVNGVFEITPESPATTENYEWRANGHVVIEVKDSELVKVSPKEKQDVMIQKVYLKE